MTFVRASGRGSYFRLLAALAVATKTLYLSHWEEKSVVLDEAEAVSVMRYETAADL